MTAKIIDGKKIAQEVRNEIKEKIKSIGKTPGLAFILVGDNPASQVYVKGKDKACKEVGIYSEVYNLKEETTEEELLELIDRLNQESKINGMIVQLPLPKHINQHLVIDAILPEKDADGFTPVNIGEMFLGRNRIVPATPKGIIKLIESTGIEIEGKHAVIVGRSNIVGKPTATLLLQKNATVTICHSKTENLTEITKQADILVVAVGKPKFLKKNMVKRGAIVIDVGINRLENKLVGDVDFDEVKEVAGYITPVPGGVGPMTIAMLLENTLTCMELQKRLLQPE